MGLDIRCAMRILSSLRIIFLSQTRPVIKKILTGNREALLLVQTHIYKSNVFYS